MSVSIRHAVQRNLSLAISGKIIWGNFQYLTVLDIKPLFIPDIMEMPCHYYSKLFSTGGRLDCDKLLEYIFLSRESHHLRSHLGLIPKRSIIMVSGAG